jgi:pimeloyl-ACP methyl ester carboxylesterase
MSTFVLIHGAGDVGWYWHLVEAELRARGHDVVAPDLPGDDESQQLDDYADAWSRPWEIEETWSSSLSRSAGSPHRSSPSGSRSTRWSSSPA